ncbi:cation transporter [archaeon]|nr:MAG: cation transporter [archaeon]
MQARHIARTLLRSNVARAVPVRFHGGHSHAHGLPVASSAATAPGDAALQKAMSKVLSAGMLSDLTLAMIKGTAGVLTGSSGLLSDAVHSAADMVISALSIVTVRFSAVKPDSNHPYGHGRLDSLGALAVSALLTSAGVGIGLRAFEEVKQAIEGKPIEPLFALMEHAPSELLQNNALAAAAIGACLASVALKEAIYHWTMRVGMAARSQVLIANAWHHRADSLSSLVAAVGIGGAMAGVPVLDPLAAMGVAVMISKAGVDIGITALRELMDERLDDDIIAASVDITRQLGDVRGIRQVRARRVGPSVLLDMECAVTPNITVAAVENIAQQIREGICRERREVSEVLISFVPADEHDSLVAPAPRRATSPILATSTLSAGSASTERVCRMPSGVVCSSGSAACRAACGVAGGAPADAHAHAHVHAHDDDHNHDAPTLSMVEISVRCCPIFLYGCMRVCACTGTCIPSARARAYSPPCRKSCARA